MRGRLGLIADAWPALLVRDRPLAGIPAECPIIIAPHHDDAAFSLGSFLARHRGGVLLNVFSQSGFTARLPEGTGSDTESVSRLRDAEDAAFATAAGLTRIDLGLQDAPLRRFEPFDARELDSETGLLDPLVRKLAELGEAQAAKRTLFVPMGIGGHRDHQLVRDCVLANRDQLKRHFTLLFYEDLPYAARHSERLPGVAAMIRRMPAGGAERLVWKLTPEMAAEKLGLVRLYPSQHKILPTSLEKFSPKMLRDSGPHEATWRFF